MIVIADTSPLNYLILIGEIEILPKLFGKVLVPKAVWKELSALNSPDAVKDWIVAKPTWIDIHSPTLIDETISLGSGETEAISLAHELQADLVLIDDRKARIAAIDRGLNVAGTINILESAARRGMVDLRIAFADLQKTNFRIAPPLLAEILNRSS
ncbi:MAG: DUF3368 domain-containing protein [Acidobacteria bacterium]|nr:DUF3368 domain-containing protein [Acidobacteriota bacterium]